MKIKTIMFFYDIVNVKYYKKKASQILTKQIFKSIVAKKYKLEATCINKVYAKKVVGILPDL